MIVSPQEYNGLLHQLRDPNEFSDFLRIPANEHIYTINLDDRKIETPAFLSVESDINGEIIWFKVNRFFDNIDLYSGACWIFYTNADNESRFYAAPLQIASADVGDDFLLIPWIISKDVAKKNGAVNFSIQFFKLSEDHLRFLYVINTQPVKSKILANNVVINPVEFLTDETKTEAEVLPERQALADELHRLTEAYETLSKAYELYWIEVSN